MTPSEEAAALASLLTCEMLGVEGYCQRSAYDAKAEFDERARELVSSGRLMAMARSHEDAELRARCEARFA